MLRLIYRAAISLLLCLTAFPQSATFPGQNGLGGSTLTCLDRDGDGYGTGPGCKGPDADDLDSAVHTGPQGITKYGSLSALINHLEGFTPSHIWYLAPASPTAGCLANGGTTGQCAGSDSNSCEDNINAPCLTGSHIQGSVKAGMAVVFRDGWSGRYASASGSSGNPIILMGYPGELPVIDPNTSPSAVFVLSGQSWLIVDGFKTQNGACFSGGDNNYSENPHTFHDNIFRHIEGTNCYQGFGPTAGIQNDTLEDSVFHDNNAGGGQAGVYWGGTCVPSSGATIRRVISYHNGYAGIHINSVANNITITQNLVYNNLIEGIALESGVNTSTITDNVVFGDNGAEFEIYSYQNGLGPVFGCDASYFPVTNATWKGGTATLTIGANGIVPGQYAYINGFTPSGYNCTGSSTFGSGTGCLITAATGTTISYAIASDPGSYVSGGYATGGVGDQANNLIENNTFYHNNLDYTGAPVGQNSAIWIASHSGSTGGPVLGDLGHNTYRNNIAVHYGDLGSVYRYAPIAFDNSNGASFLATSVFSNNLTFQTNGIDSTTAAYGLYQGCTPTCNGQAVYDATGAALNGGPALSTIATGYTITGGADGNPLFAAASPTYYNTPSLFNFGLLSGSPALHSGTRVGVPANDLFGNPFASTPSMGAVEQAQAGSPPTPPTVSITAPSTNSTVSGTVTASATATASGTLTVAGVQFQLDSTNLGSALPPGAPYTMSWGTTNYANGSHTLTAIATDSGGNTATSSISVTINNVVTSPPSSGAAWQDLSNTQLRSVCPVDGFGGINYGFADFCGSVVAAWSGAAADTKRNRLIIWGGGHT